MSSQIIETNPTSGSATTSSVRENFGIAKTEISELQRMTKDRVVTSTVNAMTADFATDVVLAEGVRITVEIGDTNTLGGASVTLDVDSTNAKQVVRQDGSDIAIGDLKAGQYADLIYDATSSGKWVWLNSPYAQLITSLKEEIAANIYPVGSIFTTTTDYSDASNGVAVTTALGMASTVQWSRYAQGRTIVGADLGTTINSASSSSNVVTLVVTSHGLSAGDSITVSGFTSDTDANGSFTVDSTTSTNIVYTASNVSDGSITGSDLLVKNNAFDAGDTGGAANHVLSKEEFQHLHVTGSFTSTFGDDVFFPTSDRLDTTVYGDVPAGTFSNSLGSSNTTYTGRRVDGDSGGTSAATFVTSGIVDDSTKTMHTFPLHNDATVENTAHNNLQPYITTYIWKRTA